MLRWLRRSLSVRLVAIFALLGAAFVYFVSLGIAYVYRADNLRELVSAHLSLHIDYVREDIGDPPRIERAQRIVDRVPVDIRLAGPGLDWASDPRFPPLSELRFGTSEFFADDSAWVGELSDVQFARAGDHAFLKIQRGDYAIVVSTPKMGAPGSDVDVRLVITVIGLGFLLLGYLAVRWLFRPISAIRRGAARIGRGRFDHRIDVRRNDELGDLAADVNAMAADVEAILDAKRQLLIGISHELRTPLSRMRLGSELLGDQAHKAELRQDIDEMEAIIRTLIEAETLTTRHAPLHREPVDVEDLLDALIADFFDDRREHLVLDVAPGTTAEVDAARVLLLAKNLIGNALRYGDTDLGPVTVSARMEGDELVLSVRDHGPGLSDDQIRHLGEPFYRSDRSRARATGGTGLGLFLARTICEAHGGSLTVDTGHAGGACLVARLPARQTPNSASASV